MTTILKAHFDGNKIVLDEPANLPTGTQLFVIVTDESEDFAKECLAEAHERAERAKNPRRFLRKDLYRF